MVIRYTSFFLFVFFLGVLEKENLTADRKVLMVAFYLIWIGLDLSFGDGMG